MGRAIHPADDEPESGATWSGRSTTSVVAAALGVIAFGAGAHAGLAALGAAAGPPTPRISSAPQRTTASRSATFAVDKVPDATLECSIDGRDYRGCASRSTYRRLALGRHAFRVRARAVSGERSPATEYRWRVVGTRRPSRGLAAAAFAPRPVLTTTPVRPYVSSAATFTWRLRPIAPAPRGTSFRCSLDGRAWRTCRAPRTYLGLRSGTHVFRLRSVAPGRRPSRVNRFTWIVRLAAPPAPELQQRPPARTGAPDVVLTFVGDAAGFECRLDGAAWQRCTSPVAYIGLGPGSHRFCVRGVSSEGTPGPETCTTWVQTGTDSGGDVQGGSQAGTFSITGTLPTLLSPGIGGPLPLRVANPNPFGIRVTSLVVSVRPGSSQPGCDGPSNLTVTQSNAAGGAISLVVPAGGSVTLPAQGVTAPIVTMANLPTNQDACKGAVFTLAYTAAGTKA